MRLRRVAAIGALGAASLLGVFGPSAFAAESPEGGPELTHAEHLCIEQIERGEGVDSCQEAPNPILPEPSEILWGTVAFAVVFGMLWKFAIPAIKKSMQARTDKIAGDLQAAEKSKTDAAKVLTDYQAQLADAKAESNRIIDEARQQAEGVRREMIARAETDAAQIRAKAAEDLNSQADRLKADLQSHVKSLSLELAEKVVGANINNETNAALVDRYIAELSAR